MGQSFLAVVDQSGLRALLPEDELSLQCYSALRPNLPSSTGYWAVLDAEVPPAISLLLDADERETALAYLLDHAIDVGPLTSPLDSEEK